MNFASNQGDNFEQNFLVGPLVVNNLLINPTLQELKDWGVDYVKNDPVYTGEMNDVKYADLVFWAKWVDDPSQVVNWRIRLKKQHLISGNGSNKKCFINHKGGTFWAEEADLLPDWFKAGECRQAIVGEEALTSFMISFNNKSLKDFPDDQSLLETNESLGKLLAGDFSSIKQANTLNDFKMQVAVGLVARDTTDKDGKDITKYYQRVYTNEFFKHWLTTPYLYQSKEKKGNVSWDEWFNFKVNVDSGNYNLNLFRGEPTVLTLAEVRKEMDTPKEAMPEVDKPKDEDPLPF